MDRDFSFLLWPKREARGPWKQGRKTRGSITCRTDRANEDNKIFIIWLCWLFRFSKGDREQEVRTATYGPRIDQSQQAKSVSHIIIHCITWHDITSHCNTLHYIILHSPTYTSPHYTLVIKVISLVLFIQLQKCNVLIYLVPRGILLLICIHVE